MEVVDLRLITVFLPLFLKFKNRVFGMGKLKKGILGYSSIVIGRKMKYKELFITTHSTRFLFKIVPFNWQVIIDLQIFGKGCETIIVYFLSTLRNGDDVILIFFLHDNTAVIKYFV